MKYLGFARKYRPKTFDEVVGQAEIATTLQNAIRTNRIHHAYLFCGSKGVGKTSMARIFAKAINCVKGPTVTPCNQCEICERISTGEDVDVLEIDGASNRGIEEIRNIKDNIKYLPSRARFKIFIIDEIHMLTMAAFNALLKTLEEPPEHVKFIFATTQLHSIPDTILSRCQKFNFKKIELADIVGQLKKVVESEKLVVEEGILDKIARRTQGAMRDSLVLLDQLASYNLGKIDLTALEQIAGAEGEDSVRLIDAIGAKDTLALLSTIDNFFNLGGNVSNLLERLLQQLRDILIFVATGGSGTFIEGTAEYHTWLAAKKAIFSQEFLQNAIHHLLEAKTLIHRSLMGRIVLEAVLLKILQMDSLLSLKIIEQKLGDLEEKIFSKGGLTMPLRAFDEKVPSAVTVGLSEGSKNAQPVAPALPFAAKPSSVPPARPSQPVPSNAFAPQEKAKPEAKVSSPAAPSTSSKAGEPPSQRVQLPAAQPPKASQPLAASQSTKETQPSAPVAPPAAPVATTPVPAALDADMKMTATPTTDPWEQFLSGLKKISAQMAHLLKDQSKGVVQEGSLVLSLPEEQQFLTNMLTDPVNKKIVGDLIERCFGQRLMLKFLFVGEASKKSKEYQKMAASDPIIARALELFEGQILETRRSEKK